MAQHQRSPVARTLRGISIFRDIPPSALAAIENRCSWRTYAPQEQIIDYLDRSEDVFFIVSGQARASIYSARGKLVTFSDLGAGAAFGEYAALDGAPRSAGIEAHGYCTVASMPGPAFQQIAVSEPTVALALLHAAAARIRTLTNRVYEFSTLAVNNRIQAEILRLAKETGAPDNTAAIAPAPLHADIASRTSTHREAVARELSRLAKRGILERRGRQLLIKDVQRLTAMVSEATGE